MLVTDCEGLGQFASAFRKGKVDTSPELEENCNWEKVINSVVREFPVPVPVPGKFPGFS
jgi:hypothetical protein